MRGERFRLGKDGGCSPSIIEHVDVAHHDRERDKGPLLNSDVLEQMQCFIDDVQWAQVDDGQFKEQTYHGIAFNCDAHLSTRDGAFYDFQCTHFWGTRLSAWATR